MSRGTQGVTPWVPLDKGSNEDDDLMSSGLISTYNSTSTNTSKRYAYWPMLPFSYSRVQNPCVVLPAPACCLSVARTKTWQTWDGL